MVGTSVAVVTIGASVALPVARAPQPTRSGRQKASSQPWKAKAEAGAAQIHQLTLAYEQANLTVANLDQQISADQSQVTPPAGPGVGQRVACCAGRPS